MSHTPGPWSAGFLGNDWDDEMCIVAYGQGGICYLSNSVHGLSHGDRPRTLEDQEANARLIAAAPDLLSACQAFLNLFCNSDMRPEDECHVIAAQCHDAINKATGEKP